jgi:ectoine hydroxylase-related dioxygenase (phytanoyl-CoA dioxygenase family)
LAIAVGSHKGLREHVEQEGVESYVMKGRTQKGVPLEDVHETWLTTDYHPGDVLIFHSLALHRALPNRSDRVRLSLATRWTPETAPRIAQLETDLRAQKQLREAVKQIATEAGASEALFERLILEMMKRGLPAEREHARP